MNAFGYKTAKPTGLWGNIPLGIVPIDSPSKTGKNTFANGPRDPARRAEMPLKFSQAILEAVEQP